MPLAVPRHLFRQLAAPLARCLSTQSAAELPLPPLARRTPVSRRIALRMRGFSPRQPPPAPPPLPAAGTVWSLRGAAADGSAAAAAPPPLPVAIRRTASGLPVYAALRHGGTKHVTLIRHVTGDVPAFCAALSVALGGAAVTAKPGAAVRVDGHRVGEVKTWLAALGL